MMLYSILHGGTEIRIKDFDFLDLEKNSTRNIEFASVHYILGYYIFIHIQTAEEC